MADYFESGFCVRTRSWHGKELLLAEAPENWDDARMHAGLMWEPRTVPLYRRVADENVGGYKYDLAEGAQMVERDDTGAELGIVSGKFELITHGEMGQIMETLLDQPNVKFDTAGSVKGGRQVYCTVLLDEPYVIPGDVDGFGDDVITLPYAALINSHDGSGACKVVYTQVRVVCANTVQAADADGNRHGAQYVIRHTSGAKQKVEEMRNVLAGARAEALRWRTMAEALSVQEVTPTQQLMFLDEFIPAPPAGLTSDRVKNNIEADRQKFLHILRNSATNSAMQGNALGLVNASIEYLDHARAFRNQSTLMGRQILSAEPLKAKAIRLARDLVNA